MTKYDQLRTAEDSDFTAALRQEIAKLMDRVSRKMAKMTEPDITDAKFQQLSFDITIHNDTIDKLLVQLDQELAALQN